MLDMYTNQTVTLKTKGTVNEYNEATYASTSISARFEYKRKLVRNKDGEKIMSEATCFSKTQIKPDDIINYDGVDWVVISVSDERALDGSISHYEAVM